ncbi:MAG: hypothetical protein ABFD18_07275 [Syntrophomonas sp.]
MNEAELEPYFAVLVTVISDGSPGILQPLVFNLQDASSDKIECIGYRYIINNQFILESRAAITMRSS